METAQETLDQVFSNEEPVVEETTEGVKETTEETAPVKEEVTKEVESSPDSEAKESKRDIPIQALLDEREKRQAAQKQLEELQLKLTEATKEPEKRPDVFEDQDGAFKYFESKIENNRLQDRMDMSREFMSMLKEDYLDREQQFLEIAKGDEALIQQLRTSTNPAKFAYDKAVKHERLEKMENLDEWQDRERAKIREEVEAELKAEKESQAAKEAEKRESITPSLAKGRSDGGTQEIPDDDLASILGG